VEQKAPVLQSLRKRFTVYPGYQTWHQEQRTVYTGYQTWHQEQRTNKVSLLIFNIWKFARGTSTFAMAAHMLSQERSTFSTVMALSTSHWCANYDLIVNGGMNSNCFLYE